MSDNKTKEVEWGIYQNVALGYLVNNCDVIVSQLANAKVVNDKLAPWMGEDTINSLVGPFGASLFGNADALTGIQIRVYDDNGEITEPFRVLWEIAQDMEGSIVDEDVYEEVNRTEFVKWLVGELPYLCEKHELEYTSNLPMRVFDELESRCQSDFDDGEYYDNTENVIEEMAQGLVYTGPK